MAGLSIWHVLIFAIVVLLLFGTSKLKNLGKDVGGAIKDFKSSVREDDKDKQFIEHQAINSHEVQQEPKSSIKS